jgi:hypothetical protein
MKLRTTEQLVQAVAAEIVWRRRELTDMKYLLEHAVGNRNRQAVLTRAAVALLYAHWEGFVKATAEMYLEFVAMQRCQNCDLTDNMLAITVRSKLLAAGASRKITHHATVVEFFRTQMQNRSLLPFKGAIRTEGNLSSTVLHDILCMLGLPTAPYESKYHLIDSNLLSKRNSIAHGNELGVDSNDYLSLHDEILDLMSLLRNQVENAAYDRDYLRKNSEPAAQP